MSDLNDTLETKREQRREIVRKRLQARRMFYTFLGAGLAMLVSGPVSLLMTDIDAEFILITIMYGALAIFMSPMVRARIRGYDEDLQDLDFEIDLQRFEVSNSESRAEKIFRISNVQLRRYYDLNLSQNVWVFGLGIFCILVGVGVVALTFYLVLNVAESLDSKIIIGVVGAVGAVLTNYVAAIYLKMHASASTSLGAFHSRLVETNQLLLGNLLVSSIEDQEKRSNTLAQLALNLSQQSS